MEVTLQNVSKRFVFDWIVKDLDCEFKKGVSGIHGINGSGKSTLIKLISGWLSPSKGSISYADSSGESLKRDDIYKQVSIVAPYTDIIVEYDLKEMYAFHTKFRPLESINSFSEFAEVVRLKKQKGKPLQHYSSGMKQRVQLALALLSDTSLLLLDEPTSFLDTQNKAWFYDLLENQIKNRTVIISSNDREDFKFCKSIIEL